MRSIKVLLAVFVIAVFIFGCGGEKAKKEDVGKTDKEVKATPKAKAKPNPAKAKGSGAIANATKIDKEKDKDVLDKEGISFSYDPVNKPDPFKVYKAEALVEGLSSDNPLLKYEVRYFRLVGITTEGNEPIALFEDPNGRAYILNVGARIGKGGGVIQSISKEIVVVTETRISPRTKSGTETVQIPIRLHPENEV